MKRIWIGLAVAAAVIIGAGVLLFSNLNSIIKAGIEEYAPGYTQTAVTVGSVDVSLSGEGQINDLLIGNPKGYKGDRSLSVGRLDLAIDPQTISEPVVVIRKLTLVSPVVLLETGGQTGTNLQQLVENLKASVKAAVPARQSAEAVQANGQTSQPKDLADYAANKRFIVESLTIQKAMLNLITPLSEKPLAIALPDLTLTNIGRAEGGVEAAEIISAVITKLSESAMAATQSKLDDIGRQVETQIQEKAGEVQQRLEGLLSR